MNEFAKAGFTQAPATLVRPPMVKESMVQLECTVLEVKPLGREGGAGNLVICEVICMHIRDSLLDKDCPATASGLPGIDQRKINHVARLGGDWYCVVNEQNLFQVEKPNTQLGIGVDALPAAIRNSSLLSGNNLGQLANVQELPVTDPSFDDPHLKQIIQYYSINPDEMEKELHLYAKKLLEQGRVKEGWQVLLAGI
jgi:hypothetical protein